LLVFCYLKAQVESKHQMKKEYCTLYAHKKRERERDREREKAERNTEYSSANTSIDAHKHAATQ
jgi:hypothetical protein